MHHQDTRARVASFRTSETSPDIAAKDWVRLGLQGTAGGEGGNIEFCDSNGSVIHIGAFELANTNGFSLLQELRNFPSTFFGTHPLSGLSADQRRNVLLRTATLRFFEIGGVTRYTYAWRLEPPHDVINGAAVETGGVNAMGTLRTGLVLGFGQSQGAFDVVAELQRLASGVTVVAGAGETTYLFTVRTLEAELAITWDPVLATNFTYRVDKSVGGIVVAGTPVTVSGVDPVQSRIIPLEDGVYALSVSATGANATNFGAFLDARTIV